MKQEKEAKIRETLLKYNLDIRKLESEQEKLAKQLVLKDSIDFSKLDKAGGISNTFFKNKIISAIVVLDSQGGVIEQKYFLDRVRFPYIPGFRAYRELPAMVNCFNLIDEKPEIVFVPGHGTSHPRLGLASHFSIATGVPTIGVADSLIIGDIDGKDIKINGKVVGGVVVSREGSRPLYVSPGNLISLKTAVELTRKFIQLPHKLPEPLHLSHRYSREVMREILAKS